MMVMMMLCDEHVQTNDMIIVLSAIKSATFIKQKYKA